VEAHHDSHDGARHTIQDTQLEEIIPLELGEWIKRDLAQTTFDPLLETVIGFESGVKIDFV